MAHDPPHYSSGRGERLICPACGQYPCACPPAAEIVAGRTRLRLRLDAKGRGGKSVTVIDGFPPHPSYWRELLRKLKAHCGTGGAVKDGALEVQGDQRAKVQAYLEALGFTVRRSGG